MISVEVKHIKKPILSKIGFLIETIFIML